VRNVGSDFKGVEGSCTPATGGEEKVAGRGGKFGRGISGRARKSGVVVAVVDPAVLSGC